MLVSRATRDLLLACGNLLELLFGHSDPELLVALPLAGRTRPLPTIYRVPTPCGHMAIAIGNVLLILLDPVVLPLLVPLADLNWWVVNSLLHPHDQTSATVRREDHIVPRLRVASLGAKLLGGLNQVTEGGAVIGHSLFLHEPRCLRLRLDAIASGRVNGVLGRPRYGGCRAGRTAVVEDAALLNVIEL